MSCTVRVPQPIKDKIAGWNLPRRLFIEVYSRLHGSLAEDPIGKTFRIIHPVRANQYGFSVDDDTANPAVRHVFTFWLTWSEDETSMIVRDCGYMRVDGPRNG